MTDDVLEMYAEAMRHTLRQLRLAERALDVACSPAEEDAARAMVAAERAGVQQLVRAAKAELGLPMRSFTETETLHAALMASLHARRVS